MKRTRSERPRASYGFWGLIEILIVAVLLMGGAALYLSMSKSAVQMNSNIDHLDEGVMPTTRNTTTTDAPSSTPGRVVNRAESVQCQQNLRSLRAVIASEFAERGEYSAALADIEGAESIQACPVGGETYEYDRSTGTVRCPHEGHEEY